VSLDTACEIVTRLTEQDGFKPTAESRRAMQNPALASRVSARLAVDPRTRDVEMKVVAEDGIVTISGETRFPRVSEALQAFVRHVDGVTGVRPKVVCISDRPGHMTPSSARLRDGLRRTEVTPRS
jgi:osmotically-inducible protein OsmY